MCGVKGLKFNFRLPTVEILVGLLARRLAEVIKGAAKIVEFVAMFVPFNAGLSSEFEIVLVVRFDELVPVFLFLAIGDVVEGDFVFDFGLQGFNHFVVLFHCVCVLIVVVLVCCCKYTIIFCILQTFSKENANKFF